MPRTARKEIKTNICHVIVQGINKEYIFEKDIFKSKYLYEIKENAQQYSIEILAYTIMDNHTHLCVFYDDIENLSKYMHVINFHFAKYYNFVQKRVGYVFRNRYYTQEILNQKQLFNTIAYIHNNPVKAGIVNNISDYKFSSYNNFINNNVNSKILNIIFETNEYMDIFNFIHKNYNELEVADVDFECKNKEDILKSFLQKNKVDINYVKDDFELLKELVKQLKIECRMYGKEISDFLKINKNKITRINREIMNDKFN